MTEAQMPGGMQGERIAILGGGIGGLATAFALTSEPDWQKKISSITIYQMGWRLGGKCASGRGPDGRIEEHGIHLFGGGYYNALDMMKRCYEELRTGPGGWPITFKEAFHKHYLSLDWNDFHGGRRRSETDFGENDMDVELDVARQLPAGLGTLHGMLRIIVGNFARTFKKQFFDKAIFKESLKDAPFLDQFFHVLKWPRNWWSKTPAYKAGKRLLEELEEEIGAIESANQEVVDRVVGILDRLNDWLAFWFPPGGILAERSAAILGFYRQADFLLALTRGTLVDMIAGHKTFEELDAGEFSEWLLSHHADRGTVTWSIVQAPLGILYAYRRGDQSNPPTLGAGAYLHWCLRTFAYVGAPFWFFQGGTGEILIAPLYEVLKRRGVKFEFFHKVEELHVDAASQSITRVDIGIQASPKDIYDPLFKVGDLKCWHSSTPCDLLREGDALRQGNIDLESYWSGWTPVATRKLVHRSKRADDTAEENVFDRVVLAISIGAFPYICKQLSDRSPAWEAMVKNIPAIHTQSLQVWLTKSSEELGVGLDTDGNSEYTALGCGYAKPFDGIVDFSPLIEKEAWPAGNRPKALWYFSDVMREVGDPPPLTDTGYPARKHAEARQHCLDFLNNEIGGLLPKARKAGHFDFNDNLAWPSSQLPMPGEARLDQQYVRANIEPSERYVIAPRDTTRYRLDAGNTGFGNLVIAGDWIRTGLNVGCVEATVMSGKLASHAITGWPPEEQIIGITRRKS